MAVKPLSFVEAIKYARSRQVELPSRYYDELQGLARAMAFTVTGLAEHAQIQRVLDSLNDAMEKGTAFSAWKKTAPVELPPHQVETIFRTNIQSAWNRGRCELQSSTTETHPWYLYDAVNDSRTRPEHAAMDGMIARHDDPVWDFWTPPNGFNCRCRRIALTEAMAQRFKDADEKRLADPAFLNARMEARSNGPDEGWGYSVCQDPMAGVERAAEGLDIKPPEQVPWFVSGEVTAEAMEALGAKRMEELLDRKMPDDRALVPVMRYRGMPLRDVLNDGNDLLAAADTVAQVLPRVLQDALAERRRMGTVAPKVTGSKAATADAARVAAKYPDDWVAKGNAHSLKVSNVKGRGYFIEADKDGKRFAKWEKGTSVGEHEFGHHLQFADPGLQRPFQLHHEARTAGEAQAPINKLREVGRRDKYVDAYIGREYGIRQDALELLSMSFQALLGDDWTARYYLRKMLVTDRKLLNLALGMLFHYK